MSAYYNENDPYAAQWLRNLIRAGHIADGTVDERSIADVEASDLVGFTQCHFFAGIGVWSYALRQAGWGDDRPVWTGSCPCQPFSTAGRQGGANDERHLWPVWFELVRERRPDVIFGEQVSSKGGRAWWDLVAGDLEGLGYAAGALDTSAAGVGAPHIRQRLYWMADTNGKGPQGRGLLPECADQRALGAGGLAGGVVGGFWAGAEWIPCSDGKTRPIEPGTFPLADGASQRVGRLRAYGNALCAPQAESFIKAAAEAIKETA